MAAREKKKEIPPKDSIISSICNKKRPTQDIRLNKLKSVVGYIIILYI
jgi:hypothetical protein